MAERPVDAVIIDGNNALHGRATCPWCGVWTSGQAVLIAGAVPQSGRNDHFSFSYKCSNCGRGVLLVHEQVNKGRGTYPATVFPSLRSDYAPEGVPPSIARDFREALDSRASGFLYGASLVGRRVLQAALREKVGEHRTLKLEIDAVPLDVLPKVQKDAADQIRLIGNDAAHADEVTAEDVDDLIAFTREVLHTLYVMPARVTAAAKRREGNPS